jgi:hypothetical protein
MLTLLLYAALLTGTPPAEALLNLESRAANQLALSLCFRGAGQRIRFELTLDSAGVAGRSRTRQSGQVTTSEAVSCPLHNRLGLMADARVEARLRWWLDGEEQLPIQRFYP